MKFVEREDGREAVADDMPPALRAVVLLIEHANQRREDGLTLPCTCGECEHHRRGIRCTVLADGTLAVEPA